MNVVTGFARACGAAASIAVAVSVGKWDRRLTLRRADPTHVDLARLDSQFQTVLRMQLETARRHGHRFTLTSTELDDSDPVVVATVCDRHIRMIDAVTVTDDVLVCVWSSTESEGATAALERLVAAGVLPPSSLERTGAATFPVDGFTSVSLIEAASERVGSLQPPIGRKPPRRRSVATTSRPLPVPAGRTNGDRLTAVSG